MVRTPPVYNAVEKVWSGPAVEQGKYDVPIGELLLNALEKHGDKLFQINHDTGETMTCKELRLKSLKLAENLEKIGIKQGDHVSIVAHNTNDVCTTFVGVLAYGAVVSLMFFSYTTEEFSHMFETIQPKLIVCDGELIAKITKSLEKLSIDPMIYSFSNAKDKVRSMNELFRNYDTEPSTFQLPQILDFNTKAIIFITSGTTGLPKCVSYSQAMVASILTYTLAADDGMPRFYALVTGGTMTAKDIVVSILFRSPRIITAQPTTIDLVLEILQKYDIETVFLFPSNVAALSKRLLTESYDLPKLKTIKAAGGPLSNVTRNNVKKLLPNAEIGLKYGMTECGTISSTNAKTKLGSVGYLRPGVNVKIMDESGNRLGSGEYGEIYVKRCCPFLGYLNNEAATKSIIGADGWMQTGDIGYFDTDGELFVFGRKRTMNIKSQHVEPCVLEEFISNKFDVQVVVVVGVHGEGDIGLVPAAVVVLPPNSTVTEADISKAIEDNFADTNYLRGGVYFVKSLPFTIHGLGKVILWKVEQIATELYKARKSIS